MNVKDLSVTLYTNKVEECKVFYTETLGGKVTLDSGWYIVVTFCNNMSIAFMELDQVGSEVQVGNVTLNVLVEEVDTEYAKIKDKARIVCDLTNQPWGDRSFQIQDPIGNIVYVYMPAPVSDEYKGAIKE